MREGRQFSSHNNKKKMTFRGYILRRYIGFLLLFKKDKSIGYMYYKYIYVCTHNQDTCVYNYQYIYTYIVSHCLCVFIFRIADWFKEK